MKNNQAAIFFACVVALLRTQTLLIADTSPTNSIKSIQWNQIGAKATTEYNGDGLSVTSAAFGARLHCVFQRLDGEVTAEGVWLHSAVTGSTDDSFRVKAIGLKRNVTNQNLGSQNRQPNIELPFSGSVSVEGQVARFSRSGLTEEYTVSADGVRQDFIVEQAPRDFEKGQLVVELSVTGAKAEPTAEGIRFILKNTERTIAYSRLSVTDATGKELSAQIKIPSNESESAGFLFSSDDDDLVADVCFPESSPTSVRLAILVDDANAVYPVRVDPTFSDANWVGMGVLPGANYFVSSVATDASGNLYAGGWFTAVGNTNANYVAKWNGSRWSALGSGLNGYVLALAVSGNKVYAGGTFSSAGGNPAGYVAQWNGTNWSPLGLGVSSYVNALAVSSNVLYAGGSFGVAGGNSIPYIAQWNGTNWSGLNGGGVSAPVYALTFSGGILYAGGNFTGAGAFTVNHIAQWNGTNWLPLGSGMNSDVSALAMSSGVLYAGGSFTNAGGVSANYIAQWNGSSWSALGAGVAGDPAPGVGPSVRALAISGTTLYVGGNFSTAGGNPANNIAQWNGSTWSTLGSGISLAGLDGYPAYVSALTVSGGKLYTGGAFFEAGGSAANYIGQWNGTNWAPVTSGSSGLNSVVNALVISGTNLYVGGNFTTAGGGVVNHVALWNGTNWLSLGSGMDGPICALAVSSNRLYAAGEFMNAGGNMANNIAQWNGTNWSPLGAGVNSTVLALMTSGDVLYAGGYFTQADSVEADYIAQWNGNNWSTLGSGMGGSVSALATAGNILYAGGGFQSAGGKAANYIAQWNGSSWSSLASGVNGIVYALAPTDHGLYVGGQFTNAGGGPASYVAQWNGTGWSSVGAGMDNVVRTLKISGASLYAGGFFTNAGGSAANYIAQWNGTNWTALGSGVNGPILGLAASGNKLYVGGQFTVAGTNVSANAATALLPVALTINTTNTPFGFTNGIFGFNILGPSGSNVVIQVTTNLQVWTSLQTNLLNGGSYYFSDAQSSSNSRRFYRAKLLP